MRLGWIIKQKKNKYSKPSGKSCFFLTRIFFFFAAGDALGYLGSRMVDTVKQKKQKT